MNIILFNAGWMSYNIFLAVLAVLLGFAFLRAKKLYLKIFLFILWLLFLPNTIYLATDMKYFLEQFLEVFGYYKLVLTLQYIFLFMFGIVTFILALYPLDRAITKNKSKKMKNKQLRIILLIFINFLIAFGVALGRIQRINSWDVFFNIKAVIDASFTLLNMKDVLLAIIIFGTFSSLIYFTAIKILKNR